jgi:hypothetical protein
VAQACKRARLHNPAPCCDARSVRPTLCHAREHFADNRNNIFASFAQNASNSTHNIHLTKFLKPTMLQLVKSQAYSMPTFTIINPQ